MSLVFPFRSRVDGATPDADLIDMRCGTGTVCVPGVAPVEGRCQLLAGHHGAHALMFVDGTGRAVLAWHGRDEPTVTVDGFEQLPWMRGYPAPAWYQPAA